MAFYTYSNITRELIEVSDFPLTPGDDCATTEVSGITKQTLETEYRWSKDTCSFENTPHRRITKLEYMNKFTDTELATIYTLAKSNVAIEIWLEKFKLATEIDLDDPRVQAGLQALENAGVIAQGRTAEILA